MVSIRLDASITSTATPRTTVADWLRDPATVMGLSADYVERRKDGQPTAATQQNRGVAFMYLLDAADAIEDGAHLKDPHP